MPHAIPALRLPLFAVLGLLILAPSAALCGAGAPMPVPSRSATLGTDLGAFFLSAMPEVVHRGGAIDPNGYRVQSSPSTPSGKGGMIDPFGAMATASRTFDCSRTIDPFGCKTSSSAPGNAGRGVAIDPMGLA